MEIITISIRKTFYEGQYANTFEETKRIYKNQVVATKGQILVDTVKELEASLEDHNSRFLSEMESVPKVEP